MKAKEIKSTGLLLEKEWNKDRKRMIVFMVLTFPTICGFIIVLLTYRQKKAEYVGIKGLRDTQKDYALKDIVGKKVVYHDQAYAHTYAIYALADLDCSDCALFIYQLFSQPRPTYVPEYERTNYIYSYKQQFPGVYQIALLHIAEKRGVPFNELIDFFENEKKKSTIRTLQEQVEPTSELSIPITKTYLLDSKQKEKQDMITSLPLDFENDEIVACPHCGNMTERHLMTKWLKEKSSCPICKKMITISDCPLVIIKNK